MAENDEDDREREEILTEGCDTDLSPDEIRTRCEARVRALVAETCRWRARDHGRTWTPGDFRILIFETTVALGAELYVQLLSEPCEVVCWEVSSGHVNRALRPFVGPEARKALEGLGFEIGGAAGNFCKTVSIGNAGDVLAVARQALRIFCDALGYRGRTPLVARVIRGTRARQAVVHHSLTPDDVQKTFWHQGYAAEPAEGFALPVLSIERGEAAFEAILYGQTGGQNLFECIDLRAPLGTAGPAHLRAVNAINAEHRAIKAFVDADGTAWLVQSITTTGGITEDAFAAHVRNFEGILADQGVAHLTRQLKREPSGEVGEAKGNKSSQRRTEAVH